MKNSFKFGFLALAISLSVAACNNSGNNDNSTSDSMDNMDNMSDTGMVPMDTTMTMDPMDTTMMDSVQ